MRYTFWQAHRSPNSHARKTTAASDLKLSMSGALQGSQGLLQSQQTPWLPCGLVPRVAFTAHLLKYCTVSICWGAYLVSSYARWKRFAFRIPQIPHTNKSPLLHPGTRQLPFPHQHPTQPSLANPWFPHSTASSQTHPNSARHQAGALVTLLRCCGSSTHKRDNAAGNLAAAGLVFS